MRLTIRRKEPARLDLALLEELGSLGGPLSRARLKRRFAAHAVTVAGRARPASFLLGAGIHEVEITGLEPEAGGARPAPADLFIPVVYEDEELLVLNKPSGVPSVPHSADETRTAVSAALARDSGLLGVGRGGLEPGILHRLDTGTSGLLAFARTPAAYERLSRAWKRGQVGKIYRAWAAPRAGASPLEIPRTLRLQLGHDPDSSRRMVVLNEAGTTRIRGKALPTMTHLRGRHAQRSDAAIDLEMAIETGVMHQIRTSLEWLGWPVVGDPVYRGRRSIRLWLHAWRLRLPLSSGAELTLEAALPEGWLLGAGDPDS